jgi:HAD superfamily hydrolase (TIGR01509 family)
MITTVIFDLDGVLIDAKPYHFKALNDALPEQFRITDIEHLSVYDGLPTRDKLLKLSQLKSFPRDWHQKTIDAKNKNFFAYLASLAPDAQKQELFAKLTGDGFRIAVVSNSIRHTIVSALKRLGLYEYVSHIVSNEDIASPKPNPQPYMSAMLFLGVGPHETLIVEDSPVGLEAAYRSGAHVLQVADSTEVTWININAAIKNARRREVWTDYKMNVVVPMAGNGKRFAEAGFVVPKPLIEINGQPMIKLAVNSLNVKANFFFLARREHIPQCVFLAYDNPASRFVPVDGLTEGAACTVLLAERFIDNDKPLLIANSDQFVVYDALRFFYTAKDYDGSILTFPAKESKWSYAAVEDGIVTRVAEKEVISPHATVGVYLWNKGSDFVKYAKQMMAKDVRVNNEFYVCPVFNEAIADGKRFTIFPVEQMIGMGTPEDYAKAMYPLTKLM